MTQVDQDQPDVSIHPPTIFFSALIIGFVIRVFAGGLLPLSRVFAEGAGGMMMLLGLGVAVSAVSAFAEAGETLRPSTPSSRLLTDGVYQRSRNPIYLAMMLFGVGFGVATLNIWLVVTTLIAGVLFNFFVIQPEEHYLARRFGPEYEHYRQRTRRWL